MIERSTAEKNIFIGHFDEDKIDGKALLEELADFGEKLKPYARPTRAITANAINKGKSVLFEGAQGALLDIDHGTYPYVTSSHTGLDGVNSGAGIPTRAVDRVHGIMKAYCTRVGDGPFPTEQPGPAGEHLQTKGGEFGATTGRPRRCGWLDLTAVRYTAAINGVDSVIMTKLDVLSGLEEIKVATSYSHDGTQISEFPASQQILRNLEPQYETFEGWQEDITDARSLDDLPAPAVKYLRAVEEALGLPISIVSIGNSRKQTIYLDG
jgi:adenylosuccinate synthase